MAELLRTPTGRRGRAALSARACHRREELGHEHPTVASYLNDLAALLMESNRLAEAEPLYAVRLPLTRRAWVPRIPVSPNTSTTWPSCWRIPTGSPRPSRSIGARLPSTRRASVPTIPCRQNLNNLALLLQATNRLAEAEPLYRRALAIDEKSLGPDDPDVARDLNNLALLLLDYQPAGRGRAVLSACAGDRREELWSRPSRRGQRPQQPGPAASGHQPAVGGRAVLSARACHRREGLGSRPP